MKFVSEDMPLWLLVIRQTSKVIHWYDKILFAGKMGLMQMMKVKTIYLVHVQRVVYAYVSDMSLFVGGFFFF
jgi:hypothetical protein